MESLKIVNQKTFLEDHEGDANDEICWKIDNDVQNK